MMPKVEVISFSVHGDERGSLVALESGHDIPFSVRRVYYIYDTQLGVPRGFHAHRTLKQVLIAVAGSVKVSCEYNSERKEFLLNSPDQGLLLEGLVWREMHDFSEGCILLVLASEHYREEDYIRSYELFRKEQNL